MKVKELIKVLKEMDPNANVLEERGSEFRLLHEFDVYEGVREIETDDGDVLSGNIVAFRAWG